MYNTDYSDRRASRRRLHGTPGGPVICRFTAILISALSLHTYLTYKIDLHYVDITNIQERLLVQLETEMIALRARGQKSVGVCAATGSGPGSQVRQVAAAEWQWQPWRRRRVALIRREAEGWARACIACLARMQAATACRLQQLRWVSAALLK